MTTTFLLQFFFFVLLAVTLYAWFNIIVSILAWILNNHAIEPSTRRQDWFACILAAGTFWLYHIAFAAP